MLKIGFIDYYLDEWHANNYPSLITRLSDGKAAVTAAYGYMDSPHGGLTTTEWCTRNQVLSCATPDELITVCDCIVVLSPDNPEMHWTLCQEALRSGKRVFVDKTFAPDEETALALFQLAEEHHTPMYSTSALRFAEGLSTLSTKDADFICTCGPGLPENYLIHQFEPIVAVMQQPAQRILYTGTALSHQFVIGFDGGRQATSILLGEGAFSMTVKYRDGSVSTIADMSNYFDRFLSAMLHFFETGEGAVPKEQTLAIAGMIETAHKAIQSPGTWFPIGQVIE